MCQNVQWMYGTGGSTGLQCWKDFPGHVHWWMCGYVWVLLSYSVERTSPDMFIDGCVGMCGFYWATMLKGLPRICSLMDVWVCVGSTELQCWKDFPGYVRLPTWPSARSCQADWVDTWRCTWGYPCERRLAVHRALADQRYPLPACCNLADTDTDTVWYTYIHATTLCIRCLVSLIHGPATAASYWTTRSQAQHKNGCTRPQCTTSTSHENALWTNGISWIIDKVVGRRVAKETWSLCGCRRTIVLTFLITDILSCITSEPR